MALTPDQVRRVLKKNGVSAASWADAHSFSRFLVYRVLKDPSRCTRGASHRIAVLLGLKDGPFESRPDAVTEELAGLRKSGRDSTKKVAA